MTVAESHPADESPLPTDAAAPAPGPRRRWWLQFRLRTLLGLMLLAAVLLGWWFQPFTVETRRDDGSLRTRFELRRDWRGRRVSHGVQTWCLRDGTRFTTTDFGTPLGDDEFVSLLPNDENFVWVITEAWSDELSLQIIGGQTVEPDAEAGNGAPQ